MQMRTIEDLRKMTKDQLIKESMAYIDEIKRMESEAARLKEAYDRMKGSLMTEVSRKNAEIDALTFAIRKICKES